MAQQTDSKEGESQELSEELVGSGPLVPATPEGAAPQQLGVQRFVYAAFMSIALGVGFLVAKLTDEVWLRLAHYAPTIGEPYDEAVFPIAGVIGALVAWQLWRKPTARGYMEEVASELSKVTWPSKKEVTNSTFVVVLTTLAATIFFAVMDQFWHYVTDKVYGL